jgi:hypothetical protein
VAIYVSGLPVVSIHDKNTENQSENGVKELLYQLFGGYGTIQNIHLYKNNEKQLLKGDGLVIYNCSIQEQGELIENVCQQVRI